MAFYPQFPAFYAYAPMPYPAPPGGSAVPPHGHPGQHPEFYAMYPPGSSPPEGAATAGPGGPGMFYEGGMMHPHHGHKASFGSGPGGYHKPGYNNRKISSDSGISVSISSGFSSR